MLRAKVLIFMIPLVLPIGQPAVTASSGVSPELTADVVVSPSAEDLLERVDSADCVR